MTSPPPDSFVLSNLGDHLRRIGLARDKASRAAAFEELAREAEEAGAVRPLLGRVFAAFRRKVSPVRAANRLRRLAALVPSFEPLTKALDELDTGSAAPCPRCGARVGPEDLVKHLWERHRLLLENGRVREPWD